MGRGKFYGWGVAVVMFVVLLVVTPAIPQSQEYHDFADQRELFLGIPNTLNVISNFPFLVIGLIGLVLCLRGSFRLCLQGEVWGWSCFFVGVAAVAFGSSYYHLKPNDARLVWDRLPLALWLSTTYPYDILYYQHKLFFAIINWISWAVAVASTCNEPMTIAFTSIMAIFIIERIDEKTGMTSIVPLVMAGIISILYWRFFDDLRLYALVQFGPCIIIPLMAILIPPMYTHSAYWLWAAGFYLLAKVEEAMDKVIYKWTHHLVSGHTLKHLCAAMVPVFLTLMLAKRSVEPDRISLFQQWRIYWVRIKESRFKEESVDCEYAGVSTTT